MFIDNDLENALTTQHTLDIRSLVLAEFNLNDLENIEKIGNYKYRTYGASTINLQDSYDSADVGDYYSDTKISYEEYKETDDAEPFIIQNKKHEMYYSLGDCFLPFRPRSGINKSLFLNNKYVDNVVSAERPRYYMPAKTDYFKYWTSYRKEGTVERGISTPVVTYQTAYTIDDAVPFVVYNNMITANRIVIKMQTNVGDVDYGTIRTLSDQTMNDPLYDYANATVPTHWRIQALDKDNNWYNLKVFNHNSNRYNPDTEQRDLPIVPKDGYVELFYGIVVPDEYIKTFNFIDYIDQSLIPASGNTGDAYIYGADSSNIGTLVIWDGTQWQNTALEYGWSLLEDGYKEKNGVCKTFVDPMSFVSASATVYREFDRIRGLRIAVRTMHSPESTFDLIELSPRLVVDISDNTVSFDITKTISGDDNGLPVGSLSTSNGNLTLTNVDDVFSVSNTFNGATGSILSSLPLQNIKFNLYEHILNINGDNKYVPLKTMYSDKFNLAIDATTDITIPLRDYFFRLEIAQPPSVLSTETTLSYAVAQVLDYIGFSNYVFKKIDKYAEPILPYFFIEKGASAAEILQRIAISTQAAMFFDEYNNFVVMTKEYLLPNDTDRSTDFTLSGNENPIANIESLSLEDSVVLNDGDIEYTVRYVQKEVKDLKSAMKLDRERVYRYKPVLLWEVASNFETKTINEANKEGSGFALGAMALNSTLTASVPYVVNNQITNNIIDFGESIYWLPRYKGYLYSNGEIIKFDAVEYAIPGQRRPTLNDTMYYTENTDPNVWISSNKEYQEYFANMPFNGKMFPTGRVRIYTEPYYTTSGSVTYFQNGDVKSHGRGQFGTEIVEHLAGLNDYWSDNTNTYGINTMSSMLFTTTPTEEIVYPIITSSGSTSDIATSQGWNETARKSSRNGIIKNFLSSKYYADGQVNQLKTTDSGTIQSSALVFRGPTFDDSVSSRNNMSYVFKDLSSNAAFKHFGTRMRIIGKSDQNLAQVANGSVDYYSLESTSTEDKISINGGSGGIGISIDKNDGSGYYFEIVALSEKNIDKYVSMTDINNKEIAVHNILFYRINPGSAQDRTTLQEISSTTGQRTITKLWGGLSDIRVDSGIFAGQDRLAQTDKNSIYDLSIEYQKMRNGSVNFYLYINNVLIKVVKDIEPLPIRTNMALFVRGSSQCMFENIYAIEDQKGIGQNSIITETQEVFGDNAVRTNEFMKKYAISGMIQSSYLSNISPDNPIGMRLYFDEFGTIMRECVHFNIEYDQAFPAFYSRVAKIFTSDRAFAVSRYYGGAYEAEFLVFNSADKAISLDESSGSYLRILGVTFTQNTTYTLSVNDFYNKKSDFSDPDFNDGYLQSPQQSLNDFNKIKASRSKYGNRKFTLNSPYIQSEQQARDIMQWMINKTLKPRKMLNVTVFPIPTLQIGDIIQINYSTNNIENIDPNEKFIIKEISYSRSENDISQNLRLVQI